MKSALPRRSAAQRGALSLAVVAGAALLGGCGSPPPRDDAAAIAAAKVRLPPGSTVAVTGSETNWPTVDGSTMRSYAIEARPPGARFVVDMAVAIYVQGGVTSSGYFSNVDSRGGMWVNVVTPADERSFIDWYNTTGRERLGHISARAQKDGVIVWTVRAVPNDPQPLRVTLDPATHVWSPAAPVEDPPAQPRATPDA